MQDSTRLAIEHLPAIATFANTLFEGAVTPDAHAPKLDEIEARPAAQPGARRPG